MLSKAERQSLFRAHRKNLSSVRFNGLTVTYLSSPTKVRKRMVVSPAWIRLWFKISEGNFDDSLWQGLSQAEKDFMYLIMKDTNPELPKSQELMKAHHNEAYSVFKRLYLNEAELKLGNDNRQLILGIMDAIQELNDRHLMSGPLATATRRRWATFL